MMSQQIEQNQSNTHVHIHVDEHDQTHTNLLNEEKIFSPKIAYVIEPVGAKYEEAKRIIAIAYSFSVETNTIEYGACIFTRDNIKEICIKSQIRETAIERFKKNPVIFNYMFAHTQSENTDSNKKIMYDELVSIIRKKIYFNGVKSNIERNSNTNYCLSEQLKQTIQIMSKQLNSQIEEKKNKINSQTNNVLQNSFRSEKKCSSKNVSQNKSELEKKYSPIISYVSEPKNSTLNNAKRIIAIVCSYDDNSVKYGASIFKRNNPNEVCSKSNIKKTALARFNSNPVNINFELNNLNEKRTLSNIIKFIRTNMHKHGVKSKDAICEK